jgi:nitrogen fixation protein FixH
MAQVETAPPPAGFRLTGGMVLGMVAAFFGLVIAVDIGMAVMAYRTFSGEVAADPYEAGLLYNKTLAARRTQAALGWRAEIARSGETLRVAVADQAGQPVEGLKAAAMLERPATESGRLTLDLRPVAPGVYAAPARGLFGAWDVEVQAVDPQGHAFEAESRLVWR